MLCAATARSTPSPRSCSGRRSGREGSGTGFTQKDLPGKPDIVFRRAWGVVFCDGDFCHGRDWEQRRAKLADGANPDYWINKIASNRERAVHQSQELEAAGWLVLRFWESELLADVEAIADGVARAVRLDRS